MNVKATILLLLLGLTASLTASPARAKDSAACRQRCDKGNLGLVCWDGANLLVCSTKGYIAIPDYRELAPGTQRKLIRAAGITVEEFRAALGCGCRSGGGRPTRAARRPGVHPVR